MWIYHTENKQTGQMTFLFLVTLNKNEKQQMEGTKQVTKFHAWAHKCHGHALLVPALMNSKISFV